MTMNPQLPDSDAGGPPPANPEKFVWQEGDVEIERRTPTGRLIERELAVGETMTRDGQIVNEYGVIVGYWRKK